MPTKEDNILNNIDLSYSKTFHDSIGFYANIWDLFSQLNLSTTHWKLMRMGVWIEGMGLGKCGAKLHMHRIIISVHPLIHHEKQGDSKHQIS